MQRKSVLPFLTRLAGLGPGTDMAGDKIIVPNVSDSLSSWL